MTETIQIYVKATFNCEGLDLQTFEKLSPIWRGEKLRLPFGEPERETHYDVVGWTDLFGGSPCDVHVAKVRTADTIAYLVWGGNSGVRVLDENVTVIPEGTEHLPPGYGLPVIWVEDAGDLPPEVRKVMKK